VEGLNYSDVRFDYFTAPDNPTAGPHGKMIEGIPSINSSEDSLLSALHCFPYLKPKLDDYDAFLVACYSAHPLVGMLKRELSLRESARSSSQPTGRRARKYVSGIFEASIAQCLALTRSFGPAAVKSSVSASSFGIVTTGSIWEDELSRALTQLLLGDTAERSELDCFAGVATTGLTAVELHTMPSQEVKARITDATARLIQGAKHQVAAVCLGCAGMAGMDAAVRAGCIRALGPIEGEQVMIVDGVVSGIGMLVTACKAGF
jgi:Asp/Glu/hydantoin racemase